MGLDGIWWSLFAALSIYTERGLKREISRISANR